MTLTIRSGQGNYEVRIFDDLAALMATLPDTHAVLLLDRNVARLHGGGMATYREKVRHRDVEATEEEKTLAGVERTTTWLQQCNATKQTQLVTVGGGIVQDIAALSAHLYYRGIPWIFVPTTLLAMCDSCIGAKSGVNLNAFKNQLGAFHSPARVLIWQGFVDTLSDEAVASGYGEILKLMFTGSGQQFVRMRDLVLRHGLRGPHVGELVLESLKVKQVIIEQDEYEKDLRRILNYGHTFGHALESLTQHAVPHGLAVAWGMDLANYLAWQRGILPEHHFREVHDFIRAHLPARLRRPITADELLAAAKRDKKARGDRLNLILAAGPGQLQVVGTPVDESLRDQVASYLGRWDLPASAID